MKIEKFNQAAIAVLLILCIIGVLFPVGLLVHGYFFSKTRNRGVPVQVREGEEQVKQYFAFCDVLLVPESDIQLIPVARILDGEDRGKGFYGSYYSNIGSSSTLSCGFTGYGTLVNVVVRNKNTGEQTLLLDRISAVEDLRLPEKDKDGKDTFLSPGLLYWEIRDTDTNGDGYISDKDALRAYLSKSLAKKLTPITPGNAQVLSSIYDKDKGSLIIRYREDSNNDKKFSTGDQVRIIELDPKSLESNNMLISDKVRQDLSSLYEK